MGKNGFSQDGFDPLICPWGMAQMLGPGLHFHHLIHVLFFFCMSVCEDTREKVFVFWFLGLEDAAKYVMLQHTLNLYLKQCECILQWGLRCLRCVLGRRFKI